MQNSENTESSECFSNTILIGEVKRMHDQNALQHSVKEMEFNGYEPTEVVGPQMGHGPDNRKAEGRKCVFF